MKLKIKMEKQIKYRCPNCKGIRFNVLVEASQKWDSAEDEWEEIEVSDIKKEADTYLCLDCSKTFKNIEQLEKF